MFINDPNFVGIKATASILLPYICKKNKNGNNQKEYRALLDTVFTFCSRFFCSIEIANRRLLFYGASV